MTKTESLQKLQFVPLRTLEAPKQLRAQIRVDTILAATATLLAANPPHSVTALQIAETAGVPVSSLYRYFPGVEDIFRELLEQTTGRIDAEIFGIFEDRDRFPTWRTRLSATLNCLRRYFDEHPYYGTLMALHIPQKLTSNKPNSITDYLADYWAKGGDGFSGGDASIVAEITMQVIIVVENTLVSRGEVRQSGKYFKELEVNLESFLANYLRD